jgi:hypothetical protein
MRDMLWTALVIAMCVGRNEFAFARDGDDEEGSERQVAAAPTMYLDLRTSYATIPAGTLSIGLGNTALFTTLQSLAVSSSTLLPANLAVPGTQAATIDLPMTVDVSDRVSLYGGVSASATNTAPTGWSPLTISSWNIGFQADLYEQKGGAIPTITWQSTLTQSVPNGPLSTTTFNNILELDYALDKDETRGLLAGVQDTRVEIGSLLARIHPNTIGYVGGYYQWPSNWKFTGRVGVQSFGGAKLLNLTPIEPFTQPVVRLDLDRMDDNDNRLFGLTAQIVWVPKPSYQVTLRTPLYLVRN